jgi:hypothetical protein
MCKRKSNVADLCLEVIQLLLHSSVFLGHLLVLLLPLITVLLKSLDFAFEVAGLDVGLAEPEDCQLTRSSQNVRMLSACGTIGQY